MGVLTALLERRTLENPSTSLTSVSWPGDASRSPAGIAVSEDSAQTISAVYRAIRVAADIVASLPIILQRRLPRGKQREDSHPLYRLLHDRPNPEMPAIVFKDTLQAHIEAWGNGYAEIERNGANQPIALWPLMPDRTYPERVNGEKRYKTRLPSGQQIILRADQVLHIPGPGFDGMVGKGWVQMARESLSLTKAAERYGANWFGSGAVPQVVLKHPAVIGKVAADNLRDSWETLHRGLDAKSRVAILEENMSIEKIGIPPEDSQFLETRRFQVQEVSRFSGIPLHLLADQSMAPAANVEATDLAFLMYSLTPRLVRWEQALNWDIVPQGTLFAQFEVKALLRGDSKARAEYFRTMFNIGAMSANDIRETDDLGNPVDGGDEYFVPLNMVPMSQAGEIAAAGSPAAPPEPVQQNAADRHLAEMRRRLGRQYRPLFSDVIGRGLHRELTAAGKAREKGPDAFRKWVREFYPKHLDYLTAQFQPVIEAYAAAAADCMESEADIHLGMLCRQMASAWIAESETALTSALMMGDPAVNLDALLAQWKAHRHHTLLDRALSSVARELVSLPPAIAA